MNEILEKRTANSQHFDNLDGTYTAKVYTQDKFVHDTLEEVDYNYQEDKGSYITFPKTNFHNKLEKAKTAYQLICPITNKEFKVELIEVDGVPKTFIDENDTGVELFYEIKNEGIRLWKEIKDTPTAPSSMKWKVSFTTDGDDGACEFSFNETPISFDLNELDEEGQFKIFSIGTEKEIIDDNSFYWTETFTKKGILVDVDVTKNASLTAKNFSYYGYGGFIPGTEDDPYITMRSYDSGGLYSKFYFSGYPPEILITSASFHFWISNDRTDQVRLCQGNQESDTANGIVPYAGAFNYEPWVASQPGWNSLSVSPGDNLSAFQNDVFDGVMSLIVLSDDWNVGSTVQTGGSKTPYVTFTYGISHTITASKTGAGSISPFGNVLVIDGGDQTFTVTPNAGSVISDVLVDGVSVGNVNTYTFNNVISDHTISSLFAVVQDTITIDGLDYDIDTIDFNGNTTINKITINGVNAWDVS